MSSNLFNAKRFLQLCKQHFVHHNQLFVMATVAYIGAIFIVLSITQIGNDLQPHNFDIFQGFLVAFVSFFGILFIGHSFPAFRSKESTINYLMIPGSLMEKLILEFLFRIGIMILALPLLYWVTFHLQGYFFNIFTTEAFEPIGLQNIVRVDVEAEDYPQLILTLIISAIFLAFVLAFTGAAMFSKQPLVKSVFSVAVIIIFYVAYSYLILEHLNVGEYKPPEDMWLAPSNESSGLLFISSFFLLTTVLMLFVTYMKLKEREV